MRVAVVSPYSWTVPGGVNTHIAACAAELRARGHEVRIIAPADGDVDAGVTAVGRTVALPFNGSVARLAFGPRVASRVGVALRRARPDVVHVHEPFTPSVSMLALRASDAPVVATFHAAMDSRAYRAAGIGLRRMWRRIAVPIAVSDAARATVEAVVGPGCRIIPNGVSCARYAPIPDVDPSLRTVLFLGRLERRKGPQVFAEALASLLERVPDARAVFAGDGPLRAQLERAVEPLRSSVTFAGRFDEAERTALLSASSVVCLPAIGGESFGLTLVEAMAAGRAIVASAIPGYAAVARGDEAVLVPPGDAGALADALAALLVDAARATALGGAARAGAARYDWPAVAAQVEDAYEEARGGLIPPGGSG